MGSAILLVIVGAWACVLVPMFLRRHDRALETQSVDRFATAMRVLSRRSGPTTDRRYVVMPQRPDGGHHPTRSGGSAMTRRLDDSTRPARPAPPPERSAHALLMARRRRTLLGLLAGALVALIAAVLVTALLWALTVLCVVALVGYVVHLRREAARARARAHRRARSAQLAADYAERPLPRQRQDARPATRVVAREPGPTAEPEPEPIIVADLVAEAQPEPFDDSWEPIPVPPPTYVTAPRAPHRVVDLTHPGRWSAERGPLGLDEQDVEVALDDDETGLDAILDRRRAVGD